MTHLFGRGPMWLQFFLVQFALEEPTQSGHGLHSIKKTGIFAGMLVALEKDETATYQKAFCIILLQSIRKSIDAVQKQSYLYSQQTSVSQIDMSAPTKIFTDTPHCPAS